MASFDQAVTFIRDSRVRAPPYRDINACTSEGTSFAHGFGSTKGRLENIAEISFDCMKGTQCRPFGMFPGMESILKDANEAVSSIRM
jgi:hypothetical protein